MPELDVLLHKAQLLLQHKKPHEAEKQLSQVIGQDPENTQALSLLARCKYEQRKFAQGIDVIQKAIALAPEESYYFYLLAFGNYQINKNTLALGNLDQAIRLNPYVADYFGLLSLILIEQKDFKNALIKANEGLAVDAENITCLNARSTALNKMKLTDDAMETMRNALDQDPENDFTHTTVGWNLLEKGRNKEAAMHFKEALRINPELDGARIGLKESLKSKILPYKWLLQYSFWINNKGKNARWFIPLGIYFVVRLVAGLSGGASGGSGAVGGIILGAYLLLVATSWIINPLANFFLLFNKDGKYALTQNEKLNSLLLIACLLIGVLFFAAGFFVSHKNEDPQALFLAGLITVSLAFPFGHMTFPLRFRHNSRLQWYILALTFSGFLLLALLLMMPVSDLSPFLAIYGVGFVIYTWLSAFLPK